MPKIETFCPKSPNEWRNWLEENHEAKESTWIIYYKKKTLIPSMIYSEAVDIALCFGWIDSTKRPINPDSFMQFFCKRKPNSTWSKINKEKIQRLIEQGLMMQADIRVLKLQSKMDHGIF